MDNTAQLEKLSKDFNIAALTNFLRAASGKFREETQDFSHILETATKVRSLHQVGQIHFDDGRQLVVLVGQADKELTSHSGKLRQFEIAKKVLKNGNVDAGIFVFHDEAGHFRFSLITAQYAGTKRDFSSFRRYTYFVTPDANQNRTFIQQIGKSEFSSIENITAAFSVEPVTKEFFTEYRRIFEEAEATIKLKWSDEKKRLYTQRFFNRMMFIAFLERKGWLKFDAGGFDTSRNPATKSGAGEQRDYSTTADKDYLRTLFKDYHENGEDKRTANFHKSRLNTLFFRGLNSPHGDQIKKNPEYKIFEKLIGDVPYLNGGLFDEEADDIDGPVFPDPIVAKILSNLVYQFNFTVSESTPLDVEVAVDPEMLGRIFEELVTGRHESGSYYTPKPVVAFMCREALKGYLGTALPKETENALAVFVDKNDPSELKNPEATLAALRIVKVCDPACGSGAYLLGMLHELLEQRECLFAARRLDAQTIYARKLEIIQNNLYGVDKDDFAVNIARLRLWLSLIVDYEGETPPPLPNLDFKIEAGDSLTAPDPSGGLNLGFRGQMVDDFLSMKNKFTTAHHDEKKTLREQVVKLRDDIKTWSGRASTFNGFDWTIEFAEVFIAPTAKSTITGAMTGLVNMASGQMELTTTPPAAMGFDIILANPPYVRADAQFKHIKDEKERQRQIAEWQASRKQLKDSKIYKTLYEKWDLYIPFLERAYQLLRQNGQMIFIIPDAYNAAKYTEKSHEFFLQKSCIERIDFCSEINLFDAGVNNTILHFAKSIPSDGHQPLLIKRWGDRDEFEKNLDVLPTANQTKFGNALFRSDGATNQHSHKYTQLENIFYVSYGLAVSSDEQKYKGEFVTEDVVSLKIDKLHPKLFIEGKDLVRWWIKRIRYLEWGTARAPAKFRRKTFPELLDASEKLVSLVVATEGPPVVYDDKKCYTTHTSCIFVSWSLLKDVVNKSISKTAKYHHQDPLGDREQREEISKRFNLKYVLAIMNSSFTREWLKGKRRSKMHVYPDDWKKLPIAPISLEEQKEFVKLVDKILGEYEKHGYPLPEKSAEKLSEWEGQLDEMVGKLYE